MQERRQMFSLTSRHVFTLLLMTAYIYAEQSQKGSQCKVSCKVMTEKKPVCASDRQSYPSKCEVRRQRICLGKKNLQWVHEGECLEASRRTPQVLEGVYGLPKQYEGDDVKNRDRNCTASRSRALQESRTLAEKIPGSSANNVSSNMGIIIPRCTAEGTYEEVQCHPTTKHCWCVHSVTGVPIPQTTMQYTRPSCGIDSDADSLSNLQCTDTDRALFNSNLLSLFSTDYDDVPEEERKKQTAGYQSIQGMTDENSKIAAWRFNSLDKNGDKQLTSHEIKELKRKVRKNIKPKLKGWTGDVIPIQDQSQSSELMEHQKRLFDMLSGESSKDKEDGPTNNRLRNADQYGGNDRIDRSPLNDQLIDNRKLVSLSTRTCMDERRTALGKSNDQTFVPRCQSDGRYEAIQCHSFSGYCWCVDVHSGLPISGTSRLKETPQCDNIVRTNENPPFVIKTAKPNKPRRGKGKRKGRKSREIPGCGSPHHKRFLTQLVDLLTKEMASAGESLPSQLTNSANMSLEEKAVRWKTITADKNNDQKLNKKEMRFVRHMVKEKLIKSPEKCAKKFMRYCDVNKDDYLTVDELLICTEIRRKTRRNQRKQQSKNTPGLSPSTGDTIRHSTNRNPFTSLLTPS